MPINKNYILMCDDVRQEVSGKLLIIGLYAAPQIGLPQLPMQLILTFFTSLNSDRPGNFNFRMKLEQLESGTSIAEGMGILTFASVGDAISPIRLGVQFSSAGSYVLSLNIEGQQDPITFQFQVALNLPAVAPQAGGQQHGMPPTRF